MRRHLALIILINIFILSLSTNCFSQIKSKKSFCDMETVSQNGTQFVSKYYSFTGAKNRTNKAAHSGTYSVQSNKNIQYILGTDINNVYPGEYFKISIWRKCVSNDNTGRIVVQDDDRKIFYQISNNIYKTDKNGWEKVVLEFHVPANYTNKTLKFYVWNNGNNTVYFDDLIIERSSEKTYPEFKDQKALRLILDSASVNKLKAVRENAFKKQILESKDEDWVSGMMLYDTDTFQITMRLKGDWLDHLQGEKWSFRIKVRKKRSWKNMRSFSIQTPIARDYMNQWFLHSVLLDEDILATRYGFVPVYLNGKSLGIYAWEEHFDKHLVESSYRREGPIVKFNEDGFWRSIKANKENNGYFNPLFFRASRITPFKQSRTLRSKVLFNQFNIAKNLMYSYQLGAQPASEIFDNVQLAKYFTFFDIARGYHGLSWHNQRFYFNPVICKLEPISFDNFIASGIYDWVERPILGYFEEPFTEKGPSELISFFLYLFNDPTFVAEYIRQLEYYSNEERIVQYINKYKTQIDSLEKILQKEYPYYKFDANFYKVNSKKIREKLPEFKNKFQKKKLEQVKKAFLKKNPPKETLFHPELTSHYVNAYLEDPTATKTKLSIFNFMSFDVTVTGTGETADLQQIKFKKPITLSSFYGEKKKGVIEGEKVLNYIFFTVKGQNGVFSAEIMKWAPPTTNNPVSKLNKQNIFSTTDILTKEGNKVTIKTGKHTIKAPLIIPKGYEVIIPAGTEIDMLNKAFFLSYSPVFINGNAENKVVFKSSDGSSMGFNVFQTEAESIIKHTNYDQLNTLNYEGWVLTGAVNFYEANVKLENTEFSNNRCEDALNIIRSEFDMNLCKFTNIFGDAFDSDFSNGAVRNSEFFDMANDAIDFSGSDIDIDNCKIINSGDKAISGGEQSILRVKNCVIDNANIAIASKDKSIVTVDGGSIKNSSYGMVLFKKKAEFGPSTMSVKNVSYKKVRILTLVEFGSKLTLDGKIVSGTKDDVYSMFYP